MPGTTPYQFLVVEDQDNLRETCALALGGMPQGGGIASVSCAEDALPLLKRNGFDVVVTDLGLPGMSGIDLLFWVRAHAELENRPCPRFLFMSGVSRILARVYQFCGDGRNGALLKPFTLQEFLCAIDSLLD